MITATGTARDRAIVTCPDCGCDRQVQAKTARNIERGRASPRCLSCGITRAQDTQHTKVRSRGTSPDLPVFDGAACAGHPTDWWFSDRPQNPGGDPHWREPKPAKTERLRNMDRALAICATCPALASCRDYTEQHPEMTAYGIWEGTTRDQRRRVRGEQRKRVAV